MSQTRYSSLKNQINAVYSINQRQNASNLQSKAREKTKNFKKQLDFEFSISRQKKGSFDLPEKFQEAKNQFKNSKKGLLDREAKGVPYYYGYYNSKWSSGAKEMLKLFKHSRRQEIDNFLNKEAITNTNASIHAHSTRNQLKNKVDLEYLFKEGQRLSKFTELETSRLSKQMDRRGRVFNNKFGSFHTQVHKRPLQQKKMFSISNRSLEIESKADYSQKLDTASQVYNLISPRSLGGRNFKSARGNKSIDIIAKKKFNPRYVRVTGGHLFNDNERKCDSVIKINKLRKSCDDKILIASFLQNSEIASETKERNSQHSNRTRKSSRSRQLIMNIRSISGSKKENGASKRGKDYDRRIRNLRVNLSDAVKNISFNRVIKIKDEKSFNIKSQKKSFLQKVSKNIREKELEKRISQRGTENTDLSSFNKKLAMVRKPEFEENVKPNLNQTELDLEQELSIVRKKNPSSNFFVQKERPTITSKVSRSSTDPLHLLKSLSPRSILSNRLNILQNINSSSNKLGDVTVRTQKIKIFNQNSKERNSQKNNELSRNSEASSGIIRYTRSTFEDMDSQGSGELKEDNLDLRGSLISEITKNTQNSHLNVNKDSDKLNQSKKRLQSRFRERLQQISLDKKIKPFQHSKSQGKASNLVIQWSKNALKIKNKPSQNYFKIGQSDHVKEVLDFDIRKSSQQSEYSQNSFMDDSYVSKKFKKIKELTIQKKGFFSLEAILRKISKRIAFCSIVSVMVLKRKQSLDIRIEKLSLFSSILEQYLVDKKKDLERRDALRLFNKCKFKLQRFRKCQKFSKFFIMIVQSMVTKKVLKPTFIDIKMSFKLRLGSKLPKIANISNKYRLISLIKSFKTLKFWCIRRNKSINLLLHLDKIMVQRFHKNKQKAIQALLSHKIEHKFIEKQTTQGLNYLANFVNSATIQRKLKTFYLFKYMMSKYDVLNTIIRRQEIIFNTVKKLYLKKLCIINKFMKLREQEEWETKQKKLRAEQKLQRMQKLTRSNIRRERRLNLLITEKALNVLFKIEFRRKTHSFTQLTKNMISSNNLHKVQTNYKKLKLPYVLNKLEEKNRKIMNKRFLRYLRYARRSIPALEYESFIINRISNSFRKKQYETVDIQEENLENDQYLKELRSLNSNKSGSEYFAPSLRLTYDSPGPKFSPFSKINHSRHPSKISKSTKEDTQINTRDIRARAAKEVQKQINNIIIGKKGSIRLSSDNYQLKNNPKSLNLFKSRSNISEQASFTSTDYQLNLILQRQKSLKKTTNKKQAQVVYRECRSAKAPKMDFSKIDFLQKESWNIGFLRLTSVIERKKSKNMQKALINTRKKALNSFKRVLFPDKTS